MSRASANWFRNSWVTGDSPAVQSLDSRILARNPAIRGNKFNLAIGGADAASTLLQAKKAVGLKPAPELVVVQGIDNDIACDTVSHKPFQAAFARVLETLAAGLPDARIFVVSQFGSPATRGQGVDDQAAPQASGAIRWRKRAVRLHRPRRSDPPEAARVPRGRYPPLRGRRRDRLQARGYAAATTVAPSGASATGASGSRQTSGTSPSKGTPKQPRSRGLH